MTQPLLSVRNLRVEFPNRRQNLVAIDDVSFDIARSEILGVVGESGAGKSVTGAAIMGLLEPPGKMTAGAILLDGERIDRLDLGAMRRIRGKRIGMVFQDPLTSLNPVFRIGDQIVETLHAHLDMSGAEARARAIALLREVGIPAPNSRIDAYPHELSGGMRQRVVLALVLCTEPELIIADEPTTALDVSVQAQIISLIKSLARTRGTSVMLITHDMGVIAEAADRVAVMYAGRIAEIGPVREVLKAPRHPYAKGLMGAIPSLARVNDRAAPPGGGQGRLTLIPGNMPRLNAIPAGCAFNPRCANAVDRCRRDRPGLEALGPVQVACWVATGQA